ncbi:sensor domain-containing diguanylate cyclase [Vibrio taketomensis]|uniref:sensor domain-containing diguanylate cyclase n=1 Tax=Vibrio taketomensis TaxID=2572923 RepID=UPI001E3C5773|nr:sensor domain-containing diguanylate cyclase [Vibrio taketomensis]
MIAQIGKIYKQWFVGITSIFLVAVTLLMLESANDSKQKFEQQKYRVEKLLEQTSQVLNALEYSITSLYPLQSERYVLPHTIKLKGNTCQFLGMPDKGRDYDFMFSGPKAMCNPQSELYREAYKRLFVSPSMAYFVKSIDKISSIYFVSKDKFVISAPKAFAESLHGDVFDSIIVTRPYWKKTVAQTSSDAHEHVIYTGDYADYMTGKRVVTITRGIYVEGEFKGVLAVDNVLHDLINDKLISYSLTEHQGRNSFDLFSFTYSQPLIVAGENAGIYLTVDEPIGLHLQHILDANREQIIALISFYLLALLTLWFRATQTLNTHLKALAMRDPMTGLLNRRGLESYLHSLEQSSYMAIAVFDIDDFKAINDTYGHQVGDEIICQVASSLENSLRQTDLISRFGGEEFVVAISADCPQLLRLILDRVQREVSTPKFVHSLGRTMSVTVSGGAFVYRTDSLSERRDSCSDSRLQRADQLLYQAKAQGKNCIVIESN